MTEATAPRALPAPGYTDIAGWPVTVLDELAALAEQATTGAITYPRWVAADADIRARAHRRPVAPDVLGALRGALTLAVDKRDDWDELAARAGALRPPRTPDVLAELAAATAERLECPISAGREAAYRESLALFARWLTEVGHPVPMVERDLTSGLPAELVRAALAAPVDDPVLGLLPRTVQEARWDAWCSIGEGQRASVARYAMSSTPEGLASSLKLAAQIAEGTRAVGLSLVTAAFADDSDDPGAAQLRELWASGALAPLLAAVAPTGELFMRLEPA